MSDVKQISVRRPGRFLRFTAIGLGVGGALLGTALWLTATPTAINNSVFGVLLIFAAPIATAAVVAQGIIPEQRERILGRHARFSNAYNHLIHYTAVSQFR